MSKKDIKQPKDHAPICSRAIIQDAIAACQRPPGKLRRDGILRVLSQISPVQDWIVNFNPDLPTASWNMDCLNNLKRHHIQIGDRLHQLCVERIRRKGRKLQRFCEAVIRHEVAHGLFTDHDLAKIDLQCQAVGLPWRLLNVFEDARIEHLERERSKDPVTGKPWRFHWWCFVPVPKETERPGEYFHALLNKEASSWSRYSVGAPCWRGKAGVDARIRDHYYHRAIHTKQTADLIALCQEWMSEFPRPSTIPPIAPKPGHHARTGKHSSA